MHVAQRQLRTRILSLIATAAAVALALALLVRPVEAVVTVTAATGGGAISTDTAATATTPAWTSLGAIAIPEGAATDIAAQGPVTIILTAPAGFEFNTGSAPDVVASATADVGSVVTPAGVSASTLTITYTVTGTATVDTITVGGGTPIQVRPTGGTPATGSILRTSGAPGSGIAIAGITNDVTNFGTLTSVVGAASQLAVTTQPAASTVAGVALATQPIVTVQDQFGNTATGDTSTVTLALTTGAGTLSGTASMAAVAGVADFVGKGLSIDLVGADKVLTATAPSRTSAATGAFTITHAAASKLILTTPPSASTAPTVAFAQQPVVTIQDAFNNTVTSDSASVVTAALTTGTGTLAGTVTKTAASGIADFSGNSLAIDLVGTDKVLTFTSGGLTAAVSAAFTIAAPVVPTPTAPPPPTATAPGVSIALGQVSSGPASAVAEAVLSVLAGDGSEASVTVPAAALPDGSTLEVGAVANVADLKAQTFPPAGVDLVLGFSITAADAVGDAVTSNFAAPVTLSFTVDASSLPSGAGSGELRVAFWNGSAWVPLASVVTINADGSATLTADTDHFSLYSVAYDAAGFGRISGLIPATGVSLVAFGGSVAELGAAMLASSCTTPAFTTNDGAWVSYLPNAPFAAINADFEALFVEGVPLGRALLVSNCS